MKKFIIIQMQVNDDVIEGNNRKILMSTIVRMVDADSKELAIGKFVIGTQSLKGVKKMDIECYELADIINL